MRIRHSFTRRPAMVVVAIGAIALAGAFTALAANIDVSPSHVDHISNLPGPPAQSVPAGTDAPVTDPGIPSPTDSGPPAESVPDTGPGSVPSSGPGVVESSTTTP